LCAALIAMTPPNASPRSEWDRPAYHLEKKESWSILKKALAALPAHREAR